jgi:hypothetical protein
MSSPPAAPLAPDVRAAVSRAQWSVLQTGLITTGLALFGVFVLANRINDSRVMSMYVLTWIPAGALLVGVIAGSGYLLAAWWFGVGVGPGMLAGILLLQLSAYFMAQYAEFQTLNLLYRGTGEPVGFVEYFRYTTENWTPASDDEEHVRPLGRWGYALRGGEAALFCLGGIGAAMALAGKPRCKTCRGQLRRRRIGAIPSSTNTTKVISKLQELAQAGNIRAFKALLADVDVTNDPAARADGAVELHLMGCAVCGCGYIEPVRSAPGIEPKKDETARMTVDARFAAELPTVESATAR